MLPIYISYFAGKRDRPLANAFGFVAGFTIVFVILGAFAGMVGGFLHEYGTAVNIVTGLIVIVLGLNYLGVLQLPVLSFASTNAMQKIAAKPLNFASSVLFGIVFAVAWTPCVGAFLGAALLRASLQGEIFSGMVMLFVYSMGLGLPLIASAILINRLKNAFAFINKHHRIVTSIAGGMLIIIGILMMTGLFGRYLAMFSL